MKIGACKLHDGARDVILVVGRQTTHGLHCFIEELGHGHNIGPGGVEVEQLAGRCSDVPPHAGRRPRRRAPSLRWQCGCQFQPKLTPPPKPEPVSSNWLVRTPVAAKYSLVVTPSPEPTNYAPPKCSQRFPINATGVPRIRKTLQLNFCFPTAWVLYLALPWLTTTFLNPPTSPYPPSPSSTPHPKDRPLPASRDRRTKKIRPAPFGQLIYDPAHILYTRR
jgi:hypothetical protein